MARKRVKGSNVTQRPTRAPTHPDVAIREIVEEALGLSICEAARRIHVSRQKLHAVLSGRSAITADLALQIGRLFGKSPRRLSTELKTIEPAIH
jgi:addiction module HigA family antidote